MKRLILTAAAVLLAMPMGAQAQAMRALRGPVTAEGFGQVRIGMPVTEAQRALGRDWVLLDGAAGECRMITEYGGESEIEFVVDNGTISRVLIASNEDMPPARARTDRGVHERSPESAIRSAYGRAATAHTWRADGETYRFWTVWTRAPRRADDPDRRGLQFVVESGRVRAINAGRVSDTRIASDCS